MYIYIYIYIYKFYFYHDLTNIIFLYMKKYLHQASFYINQNNFSLYLNIINSVLIINIKIILAIYIRFL